MPTAPLPNSQRRVVQAGFALTGLLVLLAVLALTRGSGDARYAGMVLAGLGAVASLVTALVYWPRARQFDRLFREPPLADWTYAEGEWAAYVAENYQRDRAGNLGLWLTIAAIAGLVGGGLAMAGGDILFLWISLGLAVFLVIPAAAVPLVRRRRLHRHAPRAVVGREAVWIGGRFQHWDLLGAHLVSVAVDESVSPRLLIITFRFYAGTGPQEETIRIPVPAGQEASAAAVAAELRRQIRPGEFGADVPVDDKVP